MNAEIFHTGCKVNLFLHIVGRREDGYHRLESLFYPLKNPHDRVEIKVKKQEKKNDISIVCHSLLPSIDINKIDTKNNTLTKAYTYFCESTAFCLPLEIKLYKGIPHGAGLGGGSADAAVLLKYLFRAWQKKEYAQASAEEKNILNQIAIRVGADVPFFLENKPQLARGIGDILESVKLERDFPFFKNKFLLLICPHIEVNTVWAFDEFRKQNQALEKNIKNFAQINLTKTNKKDIHSFNAKTKVLTKTQKLYNNDLEKSVFAHFPTLKEYKDKLYDFHAKLVLMSGSGSSLFALFESKQEAQKAEVYFHNMQTVTTFPCVEL